MKRALKIIIPLVVVVALLVAAVWFFTIQQPHLLRDFLVSRGEAALSQGRYSRAVWYYDHAWHMDPQNVDIAINLANAYKRVDNYTKAEYTLVSSITEAPDNLELYLELSRTYVEQDKLLDADQMLSRTTNEAIKSQLDALRPEAPVIQPEGGQYSEYIDVSLAYNDGAAYLSIDGDFPSLSTDLYMEPLTLHDNESTVVAIVVTDDGLVSPAVTVGYTIGGVIEEVVFADAVVEDTIRAVLSKPAGDPIMTNEVWSLTSLELPAEVQDLSDLAYCQGLTELTLQNAYGLDFSPLAQLGALETLDLSGCSFTTKGLEAVASLPKLTTLRLNNCALTDISPLSSLTTLVTLELSDNVISSIDCLSGMTTLKTVVLHNNTISSIAPLAAADSLESLDVSGNEVASLTALGNKTSLIFLDASDNLIADISPLSDCASLQNLDVSGNDVADIAPVAYTNTLVRLDLNDNLITELPDLSALSSLAMFSVANNSVSDISALGGLPYLNYVNIDYNQVSDLTPLESCQTLVQVDAFANPVGDVTNLRNSGVIVNYDPTYVPPEEDPPAEE